MMQEELCNYYEEQCTTITGSMEAAETCDMQAIQQLRVSIKRTRALFRLMEFYTSGSFNSRAEFIEFRTLFKKAGIIRDAQVQLEVLEWYEFLLGTRFQEFRSFLGSMEREARSQFQRGVQIFNIDVLPEKKQTLQHLVYQYDEPTLVDKSYQLSRKKIRKIGKLLDISTDVETIHEVRSLLKESMYVLTLLQRTRPTSKQENKERLKQLKRVARQLGTWHDREIFHEYFLLFRNEITSYNLLLHKDYKKLYKLIKRDTDELLSNLLANLKVQELEEIAARAVA
jgi:CHAD domain-containing protein